MALKPFKRLSTARALNGAELPADLAQFYARNEGVGLDSSPNRLIRLSRLDEVARIGWRDVHILGQDDCPGWESFAGYRIGVSSFFDEIVYVLNSPCCDHGAVLAIGPDVAGPGGQGPSLLEPSLVLAPSFTAWLEQLERAGWTEYGLVPGGLADLPEAEQQSLRQYYRELNPEADWCSAEPDAAPDQDRT